ncbi:ankyrin repeat domain-containing protein 50-like isoform X1 [Myxocyprinus asiaticus]|uniref:ankyrin repeat domain-containing protein 50-like isoform X1 n=1 Tax=Myxocyprinus asiaticus TaxID=70543 RepID=UPI002222F868|nr:ankyrin repeat domain-containing protein 50-like isoform X1 [Myxocyprinus asiaticus]XP_051566533.1 ankyrin repeat domain-containing protein 50-like isoform X1 [Myxocyprinus asiaticus]XP_051566534.1 ankyrin repeat domain-containing protein 50-like isoform X1 [Myxocyprinus asiaticus]
MVRSGSSPEGQMRGMLPSLLRGRQFYCREWALEKLQRWLEARDPSKGVEGKVHAPPGVLVTGGPGTGKTALCTELVWPQSEACRAAGLASRCLAWHYCQREDAGSIEVWKFVLGLVEQLKESPLLGPNYAKVIRSPAIAAVLEPIHCQRAPDDTFKRAILEPLLLLTPPPYSVFIVVDSLDSGCCGGDGVGEGLTSGDGATQSFSIVELLLKYVQLLPPWILLICSARRQNKAICKMFSGFRRLCLDDLRKPATVRDLQQYILRRLDRDGALRRQLTPETAEMLNLLHIKSGGCFLFLERVLDGVAQGLVGLREIRDIPGTLNGLYLWLCQRLFPRSLFVHIRPLLNILLASPQPLTAEQLYTIARSRNSYLGLGDFQSQMVALASLFVDGPEGSKLLFHSSFAEWLTDVKYCTQKFLCCLKDGHLSLAMSLSFRASSLDTEETCHLAYHLLNSGVHTEKPALLELWLLWTGVPALSSGRNDVPPPPHTSQTPVLVQQDVLQLLRKSGIYSANCSQNNTSSVRVHCVGGRGRIVRQALQREDSVRALLDSGVSVNRTDPLDGRTLLAAAAHAGLADVARLLLCHGADPSLNDSQGQTALTLASRQGHVGVLQVLLEWVQEQGIKSPVARALLEHADSEGWTALRSASWGGHKEAVSLLLEAGAEIDGCDSDGRTALRAAAWGGHEEILLTLLDHGAEVDHSDREGRTPLIAAAYMGHKEAVQIMLDAGADVNLADGDGRTALSVAALCVPSTTGGRGHGEVVSILLERGANPEHKDRDGMTPLLLASYKGHEEVVELLLEAGADVDESSGVHSSAVTPLLAAAAMGHAGTVNRMLFWGAAVDGIDGEGRTALCLAAANGSVEVVRALLDRGLDENHKDDLGWTPLHAAACEGHKSVCAVLTERGSMVRVGELDVEGRSPLILAAQEGHCSTVRLLLDRKAPIDHRAYDGHSAISAAALQGHREIVELLIHRGADTDVRDAEGRPLLYLLVLKGHLDMATLLIEKGGVPLESRDVEGRTALHVAAWQGDLEGIELLLKYGADTNAQDLDGRPPLHSVAWRGHAAAGRLLLRAKGLNIDLACKQQGATALSIAAQEGHAEIVAMLLERGAEPDHVDCYGRSPVNVAGKRGHFTIVRILESYGAKPFTGLIPFSPSDAPNTFYHSSTVKSQVTLSSEEVGVDGVPATTSSSSTSFSASCSPASTAERFHSMPASQTSSSTCYSHSTVQTVPADSLNFIQQIQQHSLPCSRSRPSTLLHPGSNPARLQGRVSRHKQKAAPKSSPTHKQCILNELLDADKPLKGLGSSGDVDFLLKHKTPYIIDNVMEKSLKQAGGVDLKWNSVMASLGVMMNQDGAIRQTKIRESPPLGYPPLHLQSHAQRDDLCIQKTSTSPTIDLLAISSPSALPDMSVFNMTTTDPQLNLKQAIKLQFEGPTSAVLHKRETPL